ncbi:MAG: hypothetical protein WEC81_01705 [Patescibacteria group bacterium]
MLNWLTPWHLAALLALLLIIRETTKRREIIYGGIVSLPILLLTPILSESYFGLFSKVVIFNFFISQAVIVFSLGVILTALYEKVIKIKIVKTPQSSRHHFLVFIAGLALSLILFDIFGQPLLPSIIYGIGINLLLAIRFYAQEINDILFSSIIMGGFFVFLYTVVLFDLPGDAGRFWFTDTLSGVTFMGIAVEKIITIFAFGLFWGPLYVGLKDVFTRKN